VTEQRTGTASIVERIRPVNAGVPVVGLHFLDRAAFFVLGEEHLLAAPPEGEPRRIPVHGGAILASAGDAARILTGGDDGKVIAIDAAGEPRTLVIDAKRRWIDRVAIGPDGAVAWAVGKAACVKTAKQEKTIELVSSAGGLAFAPRGIRLAVAHYTGVTLWFPNASAAPEQLEWKGSHLDVTWSPDGKFLVTAMQEAALHGWRLADRKDMRMAGYSAKVRSMSWSPGGKWLATAGAEQIVLWPFQAKDGPMGKAPKLLAPNEHRVAIVACHPLQDVVAAGYEDGMVLLVRIEDGAEILAKKPGAAPVSALAWDDSGAILAFGTEDGEAGLINLA
jgi:WD40 repeat protein